MLQASTNPWVPRARAEMAGRMVLWSGVYGGGDRVDCGNLELYSLFSSLSLSLASSLCPLAPIFISSVGLLFRIYVHMDFLSSSY